MAKVLAVDDSISIRQMVSHTLKDAGYEVETAADGREALDKARSLVLTSSFLMSICQ